MTCSEQRREVGLQKIDSCRSWLIRRMNDLASPEVDELIEMYPEAVQGTLDDVCDLMNRALEKLHWLANKLSTSRNSRLARKAKRARKVIAERKRRWEKTVLCDLVEGYKQPHKLNKKSAEDESTKELTTNESAEESEDSDT